MLFPYKTVDSPFLFSFPSLHVELQPDSMLFENTIACGNTEFAFFCEHFGNPALQSILSPVCSSVRPICCLWDAVQAPNASSVPHSLDSLCAIPLSPSSLVAANADFLESARKLEAFIAHPAQEKPSAPSWQDSFSSLLSEVDALIHADEVSEDGVVNEYALNREPMLALLTEAQQWFAQAKESSASDPDGFTMLEKVRTSFDAAMKAFHAQREKELEAIAQRWLAINERSFLLSRYLSPEDAQFLLSNRRCLFHFAPFDSRLALR